MSSVKHGSIDFNDCNKHRTGKAAVADLGSLSGAARQLGLSAPAVTRAISSFEAHVGARLLTRTTRSVTATEAGARLLLRSREILALVETAEREAAGESAVAQGRLTVTASVTFGRPHVADLLLDFLARNFATGDAVPRAAG